MVHDFTSEIIQIINNKYQDDSQYIYEKSELLQYLNNKTVSANKGSKSRSSFANIYAIYVLVEDYLKHGFNKQKKYSNYEGAKFSDLFLSQRELPFGAKLQNHALNHRMNQEFKKLFSACEYVPIIRVVETKRYWINENLLNIKVGRKIFNIGESVIEIIDKYIEAKKSAFDSFIATSKQLLSISDKDENQVQKFIESLLQPNVDARIFEIASFAILKFKYGTESVFWGYTKENLNEEKLKLFKTGRTNANDGGIDFVMKPLGRFFQVTETSDVKKYFLDIDKLEKYPVTFVIKSNIPESELFASIRKGAENQYLITKVVESYMNCIEEIINIDKLLFHLCSIGEKGLLNDVVSEIIKQSKIEFNYDEDIEFNSEVEEDK